MIDTKVWGSKRIFYESEKRDPVFKDLAAVRGDMNVFDFIVILEKNGFSDHQIADWLMSICSSIAIVHRGEVYSTKPEAIQRYFERKK